MQRAEGQFHAFPIHHAPHEEQPQRLSGTGFAAFVGGRRVDSERGEHLRSDAVAIKRALHFRRDNKRHRRAAGAGTKRSEHGGLRERGEIADQLGKKFLRMPPREERPRA